jgi:hypothetical protein
MQAITAFCAEHLRNERPGGENRRQAQSFSVLELKPIWILNIWK